MHLKDEEPLMIRFACLGAFLVAFAFSGPASATGGCGVGCHSTSEGACVRDGWQQGLPVRNVCPATSQPSPVAAHITDGVGNPCRALSVELTRSRPRQYATRRGRKSLGDYP